MGVFSHCLSGFQCSKKKKAVFETQNKLSQKRIADLEKHKTLSNKRVASLERKIALCHRRQDALDTIKKLYANEIALKTDKILPDATATTHGYSKTLPHRKIATLENNYTVSHNRSGKDAG
ncbi:hypothetical protein DPMN_172730 [Dreissena polymorpha]|uniref:Uncharacterized protein n=1 Tax=Dreissena polymorpha TaxID=45954 RepID=A0A9D4E1K2_DREPO|nr:hypothetical protein DPMN_172730 [Dreissena polymorpha]